MAGKLSKNQVSVLDEKIPLLSFAVDFVTAYEYQKARGIKIHPGLWKDMRVDIFLVKKKIEKVVEKSDSLFSYVLGGSKPPKK